MASLNDEEQRLLNSQRTEGDQLNQNQDVSYNTFGSDADARSPNDDTFVLRTAKAEDRGYTWKTIVMIMSTWVGCFLNAIDMSVMATLTGPISESFSAFHLLTWFINAYTIASALIQPLSGKLSDIYGRRNCLLVANFAFLLGNLICGLSTKPWHFILGRAVGGLGGGCLHSISTFLASDVIPLRSRGFWQGVSNVAFALGFAIGGTLGGVINDAVGWKWAFLFQPFPIAGSMVLVGWLVPKSTTGRMEQPSMKRIDFLGSGTLTLAILALMFGAVSGGNTFPWSSPFVYVPLILAPVFLAAFIYVETSFAKEPVIPVKLLANRTILGSCLTCFLSTTANTALLYYFPITMEVQGLSPAEAGIRQAPNAVGAFVGSLGAGALMNRFGKYYWFCMFGHVLLVLSSLASLLIVTNMTGWLPSLFIFFNGAGFGTMLVTTLLALISAADHKEHALLTSASYAFRSIGNTMGTTIAGAIFQNVFSQQLWGRLGDRKDADLLIPAIRRRQINLDSLPRGWRLQVMESYNITFYAVFAFILATYVFATVAVSIIRDNRLHSTLDRK